MSGAMRKMGVYLGLLEDADGDYAELDNAYDEPARRAPETTRAVSNISERRRPAPAAPAPAAAAPARAAAPLSRITTLHPRTYNEARVIGENFRDGIPVIMNLSEMADEDAKRLVDFAAGLIFAVRGSIERVTSKVFLLSPPNIEIGAEEKELIEQGGFFNQS